MSEPRSLIDITWLPLRTVLEFVADVRQLRRLARLHSVLYDQQEGNDVLWENLFCRRYPQLMPRGPADGIDWQRAYRVEHTKRAIHGIADFLADSEAAARGSHQAAFVSQALDLRFRGSWCLGDPGVLKLSTLLLDSSAPSPCETMDLGFQQLRDTDALTAALVAKCPALMHLSLEHNRLAAAGAPLARVLHHCRRLVTLDVSFNRLTAADAVQLAGSIAQHGTLLRVASDHNNLGNDGAAAIVNAVTLQMQHRNPQAADGIGSRRGLAAARGFQRISLRSAGIRDKDSGKLCDAVTALRSVLDGRREADVTQRSHRRCFAESCVVDLQNIEPFPPSRQMKKKKKDEDRDPLDNRLGAAAVAALSIAPSDAGDAEQLTLLALLPAASEDKAGCCCM
jgi:hypothetical protein